MTSSSSPGIALKSEGISYCAAARVPIVYSNISRGGPGVGAIQPAQQDYFQITVQFLHLREIHGQNKIEISTVKPVSYTHLILTMPTNCIVLLQMYRDMRQLQILLSHISGLG